MDEDTSVPLNVADISHSMVHTMTRPRGLRSSSSSSSRAASPSLVCPLAVLVPAMSRLVSLKLDATADPVWLEHGMDSIGKLARLRALKLSPTPNGLERLSDLTNLQSLELSGLDVTEPTSFRFVHRLVNLTELHLQQARGQISQSQLEDLCSSPSLQQLTLKEVGIWNRWEARSLVAAKNPRLKLLMPQGEMDSYFGSSSQEDSYGFLA